MKRSSYGERDYAFGQLMLTLRTSIGLTQAGLADLLGVSWRAMAEWEAGSRYPKAERLKEVIELGVRASAFAAGREAEEIHALWEAAHQKVLLEYATARLIAEVASEIEQGTLSRLLEHGLALATAREDVRQTQQRLIVAPILALLRSSYPQRDALEQQLFSLLAHLRTQADYAQGYGPANMLALLLLRRRHLRCHHRGPYQPGAGTSLCP